MFVVARDILYKILSQLNRAIDKSDLDDYAFIHLCTSESGDSIVVQAKNSIWSLQMTVPDVTVVSPVDVMIPSKYLLQALKKMPEKMPVTISYSADTLLLRLESRTVKQGKDRILDITIDCQPGGKWTGMYTPVDGAIQIDLPYSILVTEYPKVIDCVATVDNRPILTGIYMSLRDYNPQTSMLTMSGGDGYRLAIKNSLIPQAGHKVDFVFYADMWREWVRLCEARLKPSKKDPSADLGIFKADIPVHREESKQTEYGSLRTEDGSIVMSWKYLTGRWPEFKHIVPSDCAFALTVNSSDLHDAVDTCLIYGAEDAYSIRLETARTMRQVVVTGKKPQGQGKITDKVPADLRMLDSETDEISVHFDGRFVLDTLDRMPGDVILAAKLPADDSPWLFTPADDSSYKIVVMPMSRDKKNA